MTGTCKYCGQQMIIDYDSFDEDVVKRIKEGLSVDEFATENCKCPEGMEFRNLQQWKHDAKDNIDALTEDIGETAKDVMRLVVDAIAAGECKKASVKINERVSITIVQKADSIAVERSYKEKNTLSAEKM